jgi:hypothetical protein
MNTNLTFHLTAQGLLAEKQTECLRSHYLQSTRPASQLYLTRHLDSKRFHFNLTFYDNTIQR